ncbi:MAG TPA: hybrid sensor histidine kinase/response regulator, partial [Desulfovibrio sp.]|nr:hybrid sensor histidine kinase/response regulator [Desulfovibrio sp.]
VSKPVDVDELFTVMRRVLARSAGGRRCAEDAPRALMDMGYYEQRGKREFAREISRLFLEESPAVAALLRTSLERGDWKAVADQAHTLLGMAVP